MNQISLSVDPEMVEYISSKSSDLRIATTCEGPLIFSVRISPPKQTDYIMDVGGKRLYISAVQAPLLKKIDAGLLPRCAIESRKRSGSR